MSLQDLGDELLRLYVQEGLETKLCRDAEESAEYIAALTRSLADRPYKTATTALDCVPRVKSQCLQYSIHQLDKKNGKKNAAASAEGHVAQCVELSDTWLHQLQVIPGLSEAKAQKLIKVSRLQML
jgi:hypothetical protein